MLGVQSNYLYNPIKRGNLVADSDGLFDSENPTNMAYISNLLATRQTSTLNNIIEPKKKPQHQAPQISDEMMQKVTAKMDVDEQKALADLELKQQQIELLKIKRQKLEGELLPTDLVTHVFVRQAKTITTEFHNALNGYVAILKSRYKLSNEDVAKMRGEITKLTNKAIEDSTRTGLDEIETIVDDFSDKRERGERL